MQCRLNLRGCGSVTIAKYSAYKPSQCALDDIIFLSLSINYSYITLGDSRNVELSSTEHFNSPSMVVIPVIARVYEYGKFERNSSVTAVVRQAITTDGRVFVSLTH